MQQISLLLLRTQSTLRTLGDLDASRQAQLTPVAAKLALIERILAKVTDAPESLFESVVLDVLDNALVDALETIGNLIPGEGGS